MTDKNKSSNVWAHRTEMLLDAYRRADGERWRGKEIERATAAAAHKVSSSYFSALRRGRIERPGADHLASIASVMGFDVSLWFLEREKLEQVIDSLRGTPGDSAGGDVINEDRDIIRTCRSLRPAHADIVMAVAEWLQTIGDGSEMAVIWVQK